MGNRILLADDSITIQKVVNLTFADEGIEVIAVSNGDQAERRLAEVRPDLVLADIFMPGKNGYELCEAIKESPQFHNIPVILLVGAFEPFDQAEARRVKADAHLTKPFESRTLVDMVCKLISASSQLRSGPLPPLPAPDARTAPPPAPPMTQPFNLDLSAMSTEAAPPLAAPMPFNYNYGSSEDPLAVPIEVQVAEAPAGTEPAFVASANVRRKTDDLSFTESEPPFETLGLDELFAEPPASHSMPDLAASPPAPANFAESSQGSGFSVPSTFGYGAEEMLLDFDSSAPATTRAAHEPFAFDFDEHEAASVDTAGIQHEVALVEPAVEDKVLTTTLLATPPPVDSPIDTNPLEMPAAQSAGPVAETTFAESPEPIDQSALFNVDDPLGDVLDESPLAAAPVAISAPHDNVAESLAVEAPLRAPIVEAIPADAPAATVAAESPADYEVEFAGAPTAAASGAEPLAAQPELATDMPTVAPTHETGFGFAPGDGAAEPLPRDLETAFTTASMWTDEAHFAAIDIEAIPVEEAAVSEAAAPAAESFAFDEAASASLALPVQPVEAAVPVEAVEPPLAPVVDVVAAPVAEEPAAIAPPPPAAEATAAAATVEWSPALIDEIVRRVVAQMSESVVREIAWEVVPDCVERVIKDMTTQQVPKH